MTLHYFLADLLGQYSQYAWLLQGLIILFTISLVQLTQSSLMRHLHCRLEKTPFVWDDTFVKAVSKPLTVTLWFIGLTYMVHYVFIDFKVDDIDTLKQLRKGGVVVLFVWFLWRYIVEIENRLIKPLQDYRQAVDPTTAAVVSRLVKILLFSFTLLVILHLIGAPLTGLLAFGGGSAIAMGIAAQDLLANFFGGLMLYLDRPFKIGDWIESTEHNIQGTVERIGWRTTKVVTFDRRPLYIPNSLFAKIVITNPQRMSHRRINLDIGIRYDDADKIKAVVHDLRVMLKQYPRIDHKEQALVHFTGFAESSLTINIYCFTPPINLASWRDVQQEMYLNILAILAEHGAEFAFPTRTLEIQQKGIIDDRLRKIT